MAAYLIADIEVRDPVGFARYREETAPLIARFGGKYLVRGGALENVEGDLGLKRLVILEFPDMAGLKAFYHSPEYAPLIALRAQTTVSNVVIVDGYNG